MPKRNINLHFGNQQKEWTERKHALAARYFIPAAMKMKQLTKKVVLVDGYAGPNSYAGEIKGSTVILVEAARRVREQGAEAKVFACESDAGRFSALKNNLAGDIADGLLNVYHARHSAQVQHIQAVIKDAPALVFLDPQTSAELTLAGDILPWAGRPRTDVLGVFMGGDACRVCASAVAANRMSLKMEASLGPDWATATTEDRAYDVFFGSISGHKTYAGLYPLRKQEPKKFAYGIFGLSNSMHGMWLLSDAIAKDWGALRDFDASKAQLSLFGDPDEAEKQVEFDALVSACAPIINLDQRLRGAELGMAVMSADGGLEATFGKYVAADFTRAAKLIISSMDASNGTQNA